MKRSPLFIIFLTVFLDLLGFGIVIPLAPLYVKQFAADPASVGRLAGLLGTFYSLMQFLFAPVWGRLSDRVGRRPILLMSISGSCLSYLLFAVAVWARSLPLLFGSRLIAGIMAANLATAQAYIADVTTPENRAKGMGLVGAAFGLGFVFGPALGGWLSQPGFSPVMVPAVAAGLCLFNVLLAAFRLPESLPAEARAAVPERRRGLRAMATALADPRIARLVQLLFLVTFAFTMMEWTLTLFVAGRFHFERKDAGYLFAALGVLIAIVQGGLVGRLVKRVGEAHLVVAGTLMMAVALALIPTTHSVPSLMAVMALLALGNGINNPSLSSLTSRAVDATEQGGILGAAQGFSSLARAVGPFCAGWLFDLGIAYPYLGAAAVMTVAFLLSLRVLGERRAVAAAT
jgi:MFS transporter, DHA1 family, tetracycline resistance protein